MVKRMMGLGVVLAILGAGGTAWAGYRDNIPVLLDTTNRNFYASMGGARNASDVNSFVEVVFVGSSVVEHAIVAARNASGQMGVCVASNPSILAALRTITDDGYIYVTWDANNNCTFVEVRATSYLELKAP
ncbi:hypothetical protein HPC49_09835 [Pyxidicoccus fallax]|uniref:Uncharacterized protein n=1 Tax=Pyxidicoccus fallax TaxID=394095 RepID=A0A848L4G6_9BACT|nr:hypothetical protein [Pyxidicoccus fallax]NMO13506.1 hypothetical protein [Pyxidicoccus fallax]NPC78543.1 hypothetical protein [Pyxidicoccus fallax]